MKKFALLAVLALVCCALVFCACAQEPVQPETFKVLVDKLHFDVPMPGVLESGDKLFLPLGSVNGVRVDNWVIKIVDDTIKLYPSFESEAIVSAACSAQSVAEYSVTFDARGGKIESTDYNVRPDLYDALSSDGRTTTSCFPAVRDGQSCLGWEMNVQPDFKVTFTAVYEEAEQ